LCLQEKDYNLSDISVGIVFSFNGDGTDNPVSIDLRTDAYFIFQPIVLDYLAGSNAKLLSLFSSPNGTFDILKTLPTDIILGTFPAHLNVPTFTVGDSNFATATITGSVITVTPALALTGLTPVVGILTF
jgi:hypothetical protein